MDFQRTKWVEVTGKVHRYSKHALSTHQNQNEELKDHINYRAPFDKKQDAVT